MPHSKVIYEEFLLLKNGRTNVSSLFLEARRPPNAAGKDSSFLQKDPGASRDDPFPVFNADDHTHGFGSDNPHLTEPVPISHSSSLNDDNERIEFSVITDDDDAVAEEVNPENDEGDAQPNTTVSTR